MSSDSSRAPRPPVPIPQPQELPFRGTPPWLHYSAMVVSVVAPMAMLLPPRRMDLRAMVLSTGTFFGTNQLSYDYTGKSIHQRFSERMGALSNGDLPAKARENQAKMAAERARLGETNAARKPETNNALQRLWMGDEKDGWQERRAQQEKEALEEGGKGIQGLIADQISDAWAQLQGRKPDQKDEGKDKDDGESKEQ